MRRLHDAGSPAPGAGGVARTVVAAVTAAFAAYAVACSDSGGDPDPFFEPPVITSEDGVLEAELEVALTDTEVAGTPVTIRAYDGDFMPPTLAVSPGDVIRLRLANRIDDLTNLHYHGMNVSPMGNADNVFLHVVPGETFDYEVPVPTTHPRGLFYYHPHIYGTTEFQIGNGMSGGIVVDGILDGLGDLSDVKQRRVYLKDIQVVDGQVPDPPDSGEPTVRTVNGRVGQTITIRPGETQFWEIANIGADIYYDVTLAGHTLYEIERDGNRRTRVIPRDSLFLPTSSRIGVLVQGGAPGTYALATQAIDMGPQGDQYPLVTLATVVVQGDAEAPLVLPTELPPVAPDLRGQPIAARRTFRFSENTDGDQFYINGLQFDANRIDTTVQLGTVEEWTIENCSGENHVFHIHQLDFQVIERNGEAVPFLGRQDTVNLDYRDTDGPEDCPTDDDPHGRVRVLMPFTEQTNLGKFVYHCHIGEHEDNGMMQVIEVVP
jgi:FtsP/CotA-like multicopper oxidase with cupredoxin domain